MEKKINKQEILYLLGKIFSSGANNLPIAIGTAGYYGSANDFDFDDFKGDGSDEEGFYDDDYRKYLKNEAKYSNTGYAGGIVFYSNYCDKNVIALGKLLPHLDEDNLILTCAKQEIGNDCWDAVVCVDNNGDIVIHEVRYDGMITPNVCVIKKLNDYTE